MTYENTALYYISFNVVKQKKRRKKKVTGLGGVAFIHT